MKLNEIPFSLYNGKISRVFDTRIGSNSLMNIEEAGLKELLQEATKYYDESNFQIAVEKLWDAFERLKSYYCSSTMNKRNSVEKLISDMSDNQKVFKDLFDKEFHELTEIGNSFSIRHHETTQTNVLDKRHYKYFYNRCMSLIETAIQYLEGLNIV